MLGGILKNIFLYQHINYFHFFKERERDGEKEGGGREERELCPLVHAPDACNGEVWARVKPGTFNCMGSSMWMAETKGLERRLLPTRAHTSRRLESEAAAELEHRYNRTQECSSLKWHRHRCPPHVLCLCLRPTPCSIRTNNLLRVNYLNLLDSLNFFMEKKRVSVFNFVHKDSLWSNGEIICCSSFLLNHIIYTHP